MSATVDGQTSNVYLWRKDRARVTAAWRGDAAPMDAMSNQAEMERHHRQAMDHDAMRAGAGNQTAPAPDPAPGNAAMPMKDM